MAATKRKVSTDVKNQILERIKKEGTPVPDIAQEHGIHPSTIYNQRDFPAACCAGLPNPQ